MLKKLEEFIFQPSATLSITKLYKCGFKEKVFEEENLIVTEGRLIFLNQLYYTSGQGDPLTYAKVGTGGAIDGAGLFLKTPTVDLTDLYTPLIITPIVKTDEDPVMPSITLIASVDNSVANGSFINEAGFFSRTGKMFNIKIFPRIEKNSSFSIQLQWVIRLI